MKKPSQKLWGIVGLFLAVVLSVTVVSCGSGTSGGAASGGGGSGIDGGSGGGSSGGDTTTAGVRPPGLPPSVDNPTLKLVSQFAVRVNGIVDVSGSLTNSATGEASAGTAVTILIIHKDDTENPIASETVTTDAIGAFIATLSGVSDGDKIYAAAVGSNMTIDTIILEGVVKTIAGVATPPDPADFNSFPMPGNSVDGVWNAASGTQATFASPYGLEIDAAGENLYVAEVTDCKIRKLSLLTGEVTTIVGAPSGGQLCGDKETDETPGMMGFARDLAIDEKYIYIADFVNNKIRRATIATGALETFVGPASSGTTIPLDQEDPNGTKGCADGIGTAARFCQPFGIDITPDGKSLIVADTHCGNRIRKVDIATRAVTTLAGPSCSVGNVAGGFVDGASQTARFNMPESLSVDENNQYVYVSDAGNNAIRRISLDTGATITVVGGGSAGDADGSPGTTATLNDPFGTVIDPTNTLLYTLDLDNNKIRRSVILNDVYETITFAGPPAGDTTAGCNDGTATGSSSVDPPRFGHPAALVVAPDGRALYVTDSSCNTLRKIE